MPFYEFEYMVEDLIDILDKKNTREQEEHDKYSNNQPSSSKMMRDAKQKMPSMRTPRIPNISGVKMPKI